MSEPHRLIKRRGLSERIGYLLEWNGTIRKLAMFAAAMMCLANANPVSAFRWDASYPRLGVTLGEPQGFSLYGGFVFRVWDYGEGEDDPIRHVGCILSGGTNGGKLMAGITDLGWTTGEMSSEGLYISYLRTWKGYRNVTSDEGNYLGVEYQLQLLFLSLNLGVYANIGPSNDSGWAIVPSVGLGFGF